MKKKKHHIYLLFSNINYLNSKQFKSCEFIIIINLAELGLSICKYVGHVMTNNNRTLEEYYLIPCTTIYFGMWHVKTIK